MPVYRLTEDPQLLPDPRLADGSGLVAVGGDLEPERLLTAYATGIFPWFEEGQPLLWWSPDPRLVVQPDDLHVPRSLRKVMRGHRFEVRLDTAFAEVMRRCAAKRRPGQKGTWITESMIEAYVRLHELGYAHSAEAWHKGKLCGGLYGVSLGGAFFGESMFADVPDASKIAFVTLVEWLKGWGVELVDCQVTTEHLLRFGAMEIARDEFLRRLARALETPTRTGPWVLDGNPRA